MKKVFRKDSLITVVVLLVVSVLFVQLYLAPSRKQAARVQAHIARDLETIRNVPSVVAQLEALSKELDRRTDYLTSHADMLPRSGDQHVVVRRVADLAAQSRLKVTRIEPLAPTDHECFQELPFRVNFSGEYADTVRFLRALEREPRLIVVQELSIAQAGMKDEGGLAVDVKFAVYSGREKFFDFAEKRESSPAIPADTRLDGPSAEDRPESLPAPRRAAVDRNFNY